MLRIEGEKEADNGKSVSKRSSRIGDACDQIIHLHAVRTHSVAVETEFQSWRMLTIQRRCKVRGVAFQGGFPLRNQRFPRGRMILQNVRVEWFLSDSAQFLLQKQRVGDMG